MICNIWCHVCFCAVLYFASFFVAMSSQAAHPLPLTRSDFVDLHHHILQTWNYPSQGSFLY